MTTEVQGAPAPKPATHAKPSATLQRIVSLAMAGLELRLYLAQVPIEVAHDFREQYRQVLTDLYTPPLIPEELLAFAQINVVLAGLLRGAQ